MKKVIGCALAAVLALILPAGEVASSPISGDGIPPIAVPEVRFAGMEEEAGDLPDTLFGTNVLVADRSPDIEGNPDMVSSETRGMFLAWEGVDEGNTHLHIYRSTNGGSSWYPFWEIIGGSVGDVHDPALAIPEQTEDHLYVVYEFSDQIQVMTIDLDTLTFEASNVETGALGVHHPRIITDDCDYPDNYWIYVTWIIDVDLGGQEGSYIKVARSLDRGLTWERHLSLDHTNPGSPHPTPDIGYGEDTVYVTWDGNEPGTGTDLEEIYVARSTDLAYSWESSHMLTSAVSQSCYGPRVAAIRGDDIDGGEVVVAYTMENPGGDLDVWFNYSLNQGVSWSINHCLACTVSWNEAKPDVDVDPSYGSFHVSYWDNWNVSYRSAHRSDMLSWTASETVSDVSQASWAHAPPTSAHDWASGERGVAWSDMRTPTYAIYYDRTDWLPDVQTVACSYTCEPSSGVLPFATQMSASMYNLYTGQLRRVSGAIDVYLAGGQVYGNWRAGWTNLDPGGSYSTSWMQNLPALASLAGTSYFQLVVVDVTPPPYNQPPYPAAGDWDTGTCSVTGVLP